MDRNQTSCGVLHQRHFIGLHQPLDLFFIFELHVIGRLGGNDGFNDVFFVIERDLGQDRAFLDFLDGCLSEPGGSRSYFVLTNHSSIACTID